MSKIAIVYWTGTGNTQIMADAVAAGAKAAGAEVELHTPATFNASMMTDYDAIAFGCPSMGAEVLEECEFDPMFSSCLPQLGSKKIALFGSFGWGDGEWMRNWDQTCREAGAAMACDYVICNYAPDEDGLDACKSLGASLV